MLKFTLIFTFLMVGKAFAQDYQWAKITDIPGPGRDDAVAFSIGDVIYVGTGNHGGFGQSNRFYAFDTGSIEWTEIATFPGTSRQYATVQVVNGKAYLIGGVDPLNTPLNDVWEYDPANDKWNQKSDFPGAPRWAAMSFRIGDEIYYGTGKDNVSRYNDLWLYIPETDEWEQKNNIPVLPRFETIGFALYDKGYMGLGKDCTDVLQNDLWQYDPVFDTWLRQADFPGGKRYYAKAEVLNGCAYVGTGENESGEMQKDCWQYNSATDQWIQISDLPAPARRGVASCSVSFKAIYFVCGLSELFLRLTDVLELTVDTVKTAELYILYNTNQRRIYISGFEEGDKTAVYSVSGHLVMKSENYTDHLVIDVRDWSNGIYIIISGDQSAKLIVR